MGARHWTREEVDTLRELAGVKTAEEIGMILGRPVYGVRHKIRNMGLSGYLYGEKHWASKVDNTKMAMIHTLFDAGFTSKEVYRMFSEPLGVTENYLGQVKCARYRKHK